MSYSAQHSQTLGGCCLIETLVVSTEGDGEIRAEQHHGCSQMYGVRTGERMPPREITR